MMEPFSTWVICEPVNRPRPFGTQRFPLEKKPWIHQVARSNVMCESIDSVKLKVEVAWVETTRDGWVVTKVQEKAIDGTVDGLG